MKPSYQSLSKPYQIELYDQIKKDGNHVVCLGQDQTKTFILLASIKNRGYFLHDSYGSRVTLIIEPNADQAADRFRILSDHTDFIVANLYANPQSNLDSAQIIIAPIHEALNRNLSCRAFNLIVFDHAHLLLVNGVNEIKCLVDKYPQVKKLIFMSSFIQNDQDLSPRETAQLVQQLETIFDAKCETSSDLRSLSRQSPVTNIEVVEIQPSEMIACENILLADELLKGFCNVLTDERFDNHEPAIKPDSLVSDAQPRTALLPLKKQLVLVRSCFYDVIYSLHCLGVWSARKTVQLYLTELSRLHQNESPIGDMISVATTMLNCIYGRLEEFATHHGHRNEGDFVLNSASPQLLSLLKSLEDHEKARQSSNTGSNSTISSVCVVHVRKRVIAKVMALWLDKVSKNHTRYSFIKPNYIVGSTRKHRNRMAVDSFDLHHEAAVRDFRFGVCNILVTSATSEKFTDIPRYSLVVSFDLPARFPEYIQAKGNCRFDHTKYIIMLNRLLDEKSRERLVDYINMEKILNRNSKRSKINCDTNDGVLEALETKYEPYPSKDAKTPATVRRSLAIIHRYCTKLPSDSFTKLSPEYEVRELRGTTTNEVAYQAEMRLPINSPVRQLCIGPPAPTRNTAICMAAFTACKILHQAGELDDNMCPVTKESLKAMKPVGSSSNQAATDTEPKTSPADVAATSKGARSRNVLKGQSIGSTKHRQYYKKRIAQVFSGPLVTAGVKCFLYKFKMVLTCPIPDEQNRRGRRIIDPGETNRNYAIVCTNKLPRVCAFPVFTRSGEVLISVELVQDDFALHDEQVSELRVFHEFTFSKVLRLEKYPTVYEPDRSPYAVLLAPVVDEPQSTRIDWQFVRKIVHSDKESRVPSVEERQAFKFDYDAYVDAVVIPWYRLTDRQQFAYYVAEICTDLKPSSAFPDKTSGFNTFTDYYSKKYNIDIYNQDQPVLDVDHTSARLNLLTPRYVNRKGRTLPSSTAKTRRESRESLIQKQLLIPELCSIHPFPASFWRKAVCLPCIFYRLNSLFLAEELRRKVATDTRVGFVEPPANFVWPPLDFGWSLRDVINNGGCHNDSTASSDDMLLSATPQNANKRSKTHDTNDSQRSRKKPQASAATAKPAQQAYAQPKSKQSNSMPPPPPPAQPQEDFVIDVFDPSKYVIPDTPLDAAGAQDEWMNIKLISCDLSGAKGAFGTAQSDAPSGWDQPLIQKDIFLKDTNDITWSDCEMEFDGEITEKPAEMRCGSPSAFELGNKRGDSFMFAPKESQQQQQQQQQRRQLNREQIRFNKMSLEESSDDSDAMSVRAPTKQTQPKLDTTLDDLSSDAASWSSISSDNDDDDDDDEAPESSATGNMGAANASSYGRWKDSKTKSAPLLRELFIPNDRYYANQLPQSALKILYNKVHDAMNGRASTRDQTNELYSDIMSVNQLNVSVVESKCTQQVADIISGVFEKGAFVDPEHDALQQGLKSWYALMRELNARVDHALANEPNMFKDNGIELVIVDDSFEGYNLEMQPTFGELLPNRDGASDQEALMPTTVDVAREDWKNIKFDPTHREVKSQGPGPNVILQALTMSNASDGINLERLETVGDSFLKYSITAYLYSMYPSMHEGKLSYLRSTVISNANLYRLGRSKALGEIMSATKFEPNDNWLAPGYAVAIDCDVGAAAQGAVTAPKQGAPPASSQTNNKKREIDKALAEVPYDLLLQHSIPDKSIADCVEALIGAYLTASGSRAALLFMQWLGLEVIPPSFDIEADLASDAPDDEHWHWLGTPASPLICRRPSRFESLDELRANVTDEQLVLDIRAQSLAELDRLYHANNLQQFEADIQYKFRDKAYLIQAFTHNSFYENHVTDCHQRLEFLGDALLDYLITRYLFEDPRCHSPGTLTDLRSALVNNTFFASLAVKYSFHKYLQYISDELFNVIDGFVKKFRFDNKDTITKGYTLLITEGESEYAEDIEVPKALGDVFESVAGAIYLDSGMSLDQVWEVYFKMMKPEIEYFSRNVPRSPIRELLESMPQNVRFSPSELAPDRKHRVIAEVFGLGRFTGVGRNKHSAKSTAAKRALRMLALKRKRDSDAQAVAQEEEQDKTVALSSR